MSLNYRTVWISDVHLGTRASRANDLLQFLREVRADKLYLVGDIIDLERMKIRPFFSSLHQQVISKIIELADNGTEVVYIPGNHDFQLRELIGQVFFNIPILMETVHETPSGQRLLITHGDVLDGRIRQGTTLEKFGSAAYQWLMEIDVQINRMRRALGKDYFPISARVKRRLSSANQYIARFEEIAAHYANERGFDGIVCGHIHRPEIKFVDGCLYANDGDWVEHGTALAECFDGRLELLHCESGSLAVKEPVQNPALAAA